MPEDPGVHETPYGPNIHVGDGWPASHVSVKTAGRLAHAEHGPVNGLAVEERVTVACERGKFVKSVGMQSLSWVHSPGGVAPLQLLHPPISSVSTAFG